MDVTDIVDREFETYDETTRVSKLRGAFEDSNRKALVIERDGEFVGIVTRKEVLSSHEKTTRKARSLVRSVPTIGPHEDVREAARLMIASDTRLLPVLQGDDLVGVVRTEALLRSVQPYLAVLDASDVATTDVVSVEPDTSLGKALSTFRTERIEHLPVVSGDDVVGIVSLADVLSFVTRELQRSQGGDSPEHMDASKGGHHGGRGAREGERDDLLALPVRNVMVEAVGTTTPDESLEEVLESMLEFDASSSILLDDGSLAGIVTKTDLLESLTWSEERRLPVQVFGAELMSDTTREELSERIEAVSRKYGAMRVLEAKVHFQEHKERLRGVAQIHARIRLYTDKGTFVASDEGYGDRHAFSLALNAIERQILEGKTSERARMPSGEDVVAKMYGWWLSE
ncbi:CBS domain-containing protein [Natrarchaeobius oligotrophus]|uniref:CBS domain-containing protein n=1 Tax=Natrarchaeobius chitinivorans TaxID=1679083 RepID=A0A3N6NR93_NATCH|nr:CBS domain-containing protein [Natrarchaeobius chitinivorans]RQH02503.1 CBS domain-containing protein [Natrarchaeobius chitinivorans]